MRRWQATVCLGVANPRSNLTDPDPPRDYAGNSYPMWALDQRRPSAHTPSYGQMSAQISSRYSVSQMASCS